MKHWEWPSSVGDDATMWWPAAFTWGGLVVTWKILRVEGQKRQVEQFMYSCVSYVCMCVRKKGTEGALYRDGKILKPFIVRLVHFWFFTILKQVLTGVFVPVAVCVRCVSRGVAAGSVNVELNLWTHESVWTSLCSTNCLHGAGDTPCSSCASCLYLAETCFPP